MQKGNIGVTSKDIFPLIKKFMYNELDIFIREIVSNAIDAIQKLRTIINANEYNANTEDLKVNVIINKKEKTITVSDSGIGMTEDEIDNYINKIAFSGANEFLEKYTDVNIIGHFGLGFYSSFMVSDKVEIITKSYKENSKAYKWVCDGTPEYEITETEKESVGTDVIMYLNDEYTEYLDFHRLKGLVQKYSKYVPVDIYIRQKNEPYNDPSTNELLKPEDTVDKATSDNAIWTKQPSTLTDEDYINFYKETYPGRPEPLFWIHINIDVPFTFTGILYFPAFDPTKPLFEHKHLSLYCNRVFVTDNVEGVLPDYLGLLHGIIDSPDIPLNVSRSFLQNDINVKKISSHITSKVMSSLKSLMNKDRVKYEEKWDTIKYIVNLGVVTVPEVYEKAKDIILLTDINKKKYTLNEYYEFVKDNQTDKNGKTIYLYTNNTESQYTYVEAVKKMGYNILLMDNQYSAFEVQSYEVEAKDQNIEYRRIDSVAPNLLIEKEEKKGKELADNMKHMLMSLFNGSGRTYKDAYHQFAVDNLGKDELPIIIVVDEWFRRMKEMATLNNQGMYIDEKPTLKFILNSDAKIIKKILKIAEKEIGNEINEINETLTDLNKKAEENKDNKEETEKINDEINKIINKKETVIKEFAAKENHISELIDIALLQYGLLGGEDLLNFVKRSITLIEK